MPGLILASTSVYRRQLLGRLGIPFDCEAPGIEETPQPGEAAPALVARLARAKAEAVAARHPQHWVIGSDQMAVLDEHDGSQAVLGKPGTERGCREQLLRCSGRPLAFLTAVALLRRSPAAQIEFVDTTRVVFRTLGVAEVERYVAREAPLDCAGGFKSEALGISLCRSVETTDPTALIGLPLIRLCEALRCAGFEVP